MDILKFAGRRNCILEKVIKNHSIMILAIDEKMKVVVEKIESNSSDDLSRLGFCNENRNTYIFKRIYEKICNDIESADLLVERLAEDIRNGKNIERKRVVNAIDIIKEDASNKINVKDALKKLRVSEKDEKKIIEHVINERRKGKSYKKILLDLRVNFGVRTTDEKIVRGLYVYSCYARNENPILNSNKVSKAREEQEG